MTNNVEPAYKESKLKVVNVLVLAGPFYSLLASSKYNKMDIINPT